jgi:hypothetical protein
VFSKYEQFLQLPFLELCHELDQLLRPNASRLVEAEASVFREGVLGFTVSWIDRQSDLGLRWMPTARSRRDPDWATLETTAPKDEYRVNTLKLDTEVPVVDQPDLPDAQGTRLA